MLVNALDCNSVVSLLRGMGLMVLIYEVRLRMKEQEVCKNGNSFYILSVWGASHFLTEK